jgi:predicted unusual protein kinase regulating ubiquinone biosynthesis (AarF/ABC1/UbiB family)
MDWMTGQHLSEFSEEVFSDEVGNRLGQSLWDFYMYQIHGLRKVHADPHPGNFLVSPEEELIAIDFGCIKVIPNEFYEPYFELARKESLEDEEFFTRKLEELEILVPSDSPKEREYFKALFHEMLSLFTSPFQSEEFYFGDEHFWAQIADLSQRYSQDDQLKKMNGNRGSKHFLYMNRTFFGLYNLLYDLNARVEVNRFRQYLEPAVEVAI